MKVNGSERRNKDMEEIAGSGGSRLYFDLLQALMGEYLLAPDSEQSFFLSFCVCSITIITTTIL